MAPPWRGGRAARRGGPHVYVRGAPSRWTVPPARRGAPRAAWNRLVHPRAPEETRAAAAAAARQLPPPPTRSTGDGAAAFVRRGAFQLVRETAEARRAARERLERRVQEARLRRKLLQRKEMLQRKEAGGGEAERGVTTRRVKKRPSGYVRTEGGMGLQRRKASAGEGTAARLTVDFKRRREKQQRADARREAKASVLCSYFCRRGSCFRAGVECPYEHNVDKVAICQRFLHHACDDALCPLSHDPTPDRMPLCRLFLRGLCADPACTFAHVHLGGVAPCRDFSRCGYCAAGTACEFRHEQTCAQHRATGECALGEQCKLRRVRGKEVVREEEPEAEGSSGGDGSDARSAEGGGSDLESDGGAAASQGEWSPSKPALMRSSSICPRLDS